MRWRKHDLSADRRHRGLRQARHAGAATTRGVPAHRRRWTASSPATSRTARAPTTRSTCGLARDELHRRATRAACSPTRLRPARGRPRGGRLRPHAPAPLARPRTTTSTPELEQPARVRPSAAGGSIVITPEGRGPDGFYARPRRGRHVRGLGRRRAPLQARPRLRPTIAGYSMGGFGTSASPSSSPDLVRARPSRRSGAPVGGDALLASLRNVPVLMWNAPRRRARALPGRARQRGSTLDGTATATSSTASARRRRSRPRRPPTTSRSRSTTTSPRPRGSSATPSVVRDPAHVTYTYARSLDKPPQPRRRRPRVLDRRRSRCAPARSPGHGGRRLPRLRHRRRAGDRVPVPAPAR